jgi:CBS domain-containing protein
VVHTAGPDEPVEAAAARMRDARVGCLVVLDDRRRPLGLLTDRDLVVRVLAQGSGPGMRVGDVMTTDPTVVTADVPVEDALRTMRRRGLRRLPVVDDEGRLEGLLAADDVLELLADELRQVGDLIGRQAPRRVLEPAPRPRASRRARRS